VQAPDGIVDLYDIGRASAGSAGCAHQRSCHAGNAGDLDPGLERFGPDGSILTGGQAVAAARKEVVDPVVGGEKALSVPRRLETLHLPLSPSGGLVRVLCSIVQPLVLPVLDAGHDLPLGSLAARQLARDHDPRRTALLLQQLAQQAEGGVLVAPALDEMGYPGQPVCGGFLSAAA